MGYILNLSENGRILSASPAEFACQKGVWVDLLPEGDLADYRYEEDRYIYDPLPVAPETPGQMDRLEAQLIYTAMMTGTLLEV